MSNVFYAARKTIKQYAHGGNILIAAIVLALVLVNIPACTDFYNGLWTHKIALQLDSFNLFSHNGHPMSIMEFINDALMTVFFFTIGLEIKREVLVGELSSFKQALLPIVAAIGGMAMPVLIFWSISAGTPWQGGAAIPMATDIAFSLGVLAMLGSRVPISLKVFLTTLAVVDDIGGIVVIALFYTTHISLLMLGAAALLLLVLALGGMMQIQTKMFYLGIGVVIWFLFLNAGIHPTISGVLVAFCVPAKPVFAPRNYIRTIRKEISRFAAEDDDKLNSRTILSKEQINWLKEVESASDKVISPLQDLEDTLHPVVNWLIVPLFAFANAGIFLGNISLGSLFSGVSLAVMVSLVLGKFLGIFIFTWLCVKLRCAPMPEGSNWKMIAAVAMIGGIGFTVSIFIANLSFGAGNPALLELLDDAKLGILVGSVTAGFLGWLLLHLTLPMEPAHPVDYDD